MLQHYSSVRLLCVSCLRVPPDDAVVVIVVVVAGGAGVAVVDVALQLVSKGSADTHANVVESRAQLASRQEEEEDPALVALHVS